GDDLSARGDLRLPVDVDDLDAAAIARPQPPDIRHRLGTARRHAGNIQAQGGSICIEFLGRTLELNGMTMLGGIGAAWLQAPSRDLVSGLMSRPTRTRSVLDRSPIIFRTGSGNFRTSVGIARI